jgi:hypothetical protein
MQVHCLLLCFSFFGWSLNAQHVLRPSAEIPAAGISNSVTAGPVRCDPHGDIYLRVASAPDVTHELLTRIGRDGDMTTFGPEKISDPELKEWRLADFALSGAVWALARTPSNKSYLLRFDAKGEYKRAVGLDADFYPQQLAVFDAGDFLVSGIQQTGSGDSAQFTPVTAMFDKNGKFLKRISLEEDGESKEQQEPAKSYREAGAVITLGEAETWGGEIYVLRATGKPVVYVISAGGTVARRLALETPSPVFKTGGMRVTESQIAVEFWKPESDPSPNRRVEYVVYDAFRGAKLASYTLSPGLQGLFACFDGRGGFDFLGAAENGTRIIIRAGAN